MIERFFDYQLKYAHIIVAIFFFITAFLSVYAVDVSIDPSFSNLISDDSEYNTNDKVLANTLDRNQNFLIFFKPDPDSSLINRPTKVTDENVSRYIERVKQTVSESQYVTSTAGPQVNDDEQYAQILLDVTTPRRVGGFQTVLPDVQQKFSQVDTYPGIESTLTGFPLLLNRVNTLLIQDNINTLLITFVALFIVLYAYFRNLRHTLITLTIPTVSLIALLGLMTILNIPITITLAVVGILTLGLGVDFAIHILVGYKTYREDGLSHRKSILEAYKHLHVAIFASVITTMVGFTALMFGMSPSTQSQGIVLTISIVLIGLLTVFLLPSLLYLFGNARRLETAEFFETLKSYLRKLASWQTKYPKYILGILAIVTLVMFFGMFQVGFDTSNDNWIPPNDKVQETFRESSYAFGDSLNSIELIVTTENNDLRDPQVVRDIQSLEKRLSSLTSISRVSSPVSSISLEQEDIRQALEQGKQRGTVSEEYTLTTINVGVENFEQDESGQSPVLADIRRVVDENPIRYSSVGFFGDVIRFNELGESLSQDTAITTIISFALVFLVASLVYLSIKVGFTALLPIIIGIIWTVGLMGYTNVPFTSLSTGLISLVLGIGVDFSIHLVNSIYNFIENGMTLEDSIDRTMRSSGGALLLTTISTFIGFASLLLATLLGIQRLGLSLAFSILSVFIVTIVMVPAIISLGRQNGLDKKKRNMEKDVESSIGVS